MHSIMYVSCLYIVSINCRDPGDQVDDSITVTGYREPGMRGANVTYSCPSRLTLTGPRRSTCMGNGEWELDPREVECKVRNTQFTKLH